jgi:hypothetical protein
MVWMERTNVQVKGLTGPQIASNGGAFSFCGA